MHFDNIPYDAGLYGMAEARHNFIVTLPPVSVLPVATFNMPEYYKNGFGAVFNMAIDKYIFVTVKRHGELSGQQYRLNYSSTENVDNVDDIENGGKEEVCVVRSTRHFTSKCRGRPSGSKALVINSFAVGLLNALHTMRGERITWEQLAEEAVHVELERLNRPMGKQIQFCRGVRGNELYSV